MSFYNPVRVERTISLIQGKALPLYLFSKCFIWLYNPVGSEWFANRVAEVDIVMCVNIIPKNLFLATPII